MTKKYLGLAAGLLLLAGCSNNDFTNYGANDAPEGQMRTISTISASVDNADTRLVLENNQLIWEGQEYAYVFSDTETVGFHDYKMSYLDSKLNTADFSGDEISGTEFYAFIPSPSAVNFSAKEATLRWGYDVIYDQVNYNRYIPMLAKSTSAMMQFKQLAGILHFKIYGKGILLNLVLQGNNGEKFYQNYKLNYAADEIKLVPASVSEEEPSSIVETIMASTDGVAQYLEADKPFDVYFVLPAGMTFEKGFTISGMTEIEDLETATHSFVPFEKTFSNSFTVTRAEISNFEAFSTTGVLPTPEPEKGWISNFFDLSGTDVGTYFYVFNDKVDWSFAFLLDGEAEDMPQDVIIIEFFTDYTGGTPSLSWLEGAEVHDLMASRLHGPDGNIYRIGDSSGFKMKKNSDGTWSMSLENATVYDNNASSVKMEGIYLKFKGYLMGEEPETAWTISGGLNFGGNEADVSAEVTSSLIYWSFTFADLDEDDNMKSNMLMGFETPYEGQTPTLSMLENFQTTDFRAVVHDFSTGIENPNWRMEGDETMLTITRSGDVWTISFEGMAFENNDGAVSGGVDFKYEGQLTLPSQPTWSFSGNANMDD